MYEILILWYIIRILILLLDFDFVKKKNRSTKLVLIVAFILKLMTN